MISQRSQVRILRRIASEASRRAAGYFRPLIPSKTLRDALTAIPGEYGLIDGAPGAKSALFIPHYWALFVHDGRGPVRPVHKRVLVWFADPRDDPRTDGTRNYPVRLDQRRRLTADQYRRGLEENRSRKERGLEPYMIVTTVSGPVQATPFFEASTTAFEQEVMPLLGDLFHRLVLSAWQPARPVRARPARVVVR